MIDGYLKVAAITPNVRVADVEFNCNEICKCIEEAAGKKVKLMVFPELCITGYTCQDLFFQDRLLEATKEALLKIAKHSQGVDALIFVGLPLSVDAKLYNVAAALCNGEILGIVPKTFLPNYNEFYEARHILFECNEMPSFRVASELCEDLWVPDPPSTAHCLAGATVIANLSASNEIIGKSRYRRNLVSSQSARLVCAYLYASAGPGESTQDVVYSGHNIIAENGNVLCESGRFSENMIVSEIDLEYLESERRHMTTYEADSSVKYNHVGFSLNKEHAELTRHIDPNPFVPALGQERDMRCNEILTIQAMGLRKRLDHISTLAFLVLAKAFDYLNFDRNGIIAVTMPGFGTTDRTYENAVGLIKEIGASFMEVNISKAVKQHFADICHDENAHDVTYENSQARERTQILMDIANKENGIVIGTGDLSELALGWATYNGDHMSMYAVNSSVPKTLVRYLVQYYADTTDDRRLRETLYDILDTPVSPELLPPDGGEITQKTEDLVGPYELHDFFLYHMLRLSQSPGKIYRLAKIAFTGEYSDDVILKWEKTFYRRFFAQQFKRSCLPDGPKVGSVAVSPRGDLRMPSDACVNTWLEELDNL